MFSRWLIIAIEGFGYATLLAAPVDYLKDVKPVLSAQCYECHGAAAQKGGLRVDTAAAAVKGGDDGPSVIAGRGTDSLLIKALLGTAQDIHRMPLKKPPLSAQTVGLIQSWIDQGAAAPSDEKPQQRTDGSSHWSFIPPKRPAEPIVKQADWPRNSIDRFILAQLEEKKIQPSSEADRVTLIRRVSFDLVGLPPTPEEVRAFIEDQRPDAYERVVDRLLASPHYGERWGRHWLDVARYADSNGYSIDAPRSIWKYRDWVIDAFNHDLPYDQFVIDQLAGDLLPNATLEQKIATGFHRNTMINEEGGVDKEQFRVESIIDRVNTTGTAFLGVTIGCCQCHDHKFDPFTQKEYYRLFAFFNNCDEPVLDLAGPDELATRKAIRQEISDLDASMQKHFDTLVTEEATWEKALTPDQVAKFPAEITTVLETPPASRTARQKRQLTEVFRPDDPEIKANKAKSSALEKRLKAAEKSATTLVLSERATPRDSFVFIKGDFTRHGDRVTPGVPAVLPPLVTTNVPTRLDLQGMEWNGMEWNGMEWNGMEWNGMEWNGMDCRSWNDPLTARVIMNRIWQEYFGKGIVETENDFGMQGDAPSHPELLDWLATELVRQKWSLKAMHRLIVTSAVYRQSSRARPDLDLVDPNNHLLARQARFRLDAEIVRDTALSASGLLDGAIGGPSVFPPQPDGVMTLGQTKREWKASKGGDRYRRAMYTYFWRATPHPDLIVFDAPDATSACTRRMRSNTPLQSLTLLNDEGFFEMAQALAARVLKEAPKDGQIDYAFALCTARQPNPVEHQRLEELLSQQLAENQPEREAWTTVARVLLNLDETITRE